MTDEKTPEDVLQKNLARCADGIAACMANADDAIYRDSPYVRGDEMHRAVALLHASARLADALARLRGRQIIHVTREGDTPASRGSNGQSGDG